MCLYAGCTEFCTAPMHISKPVKQEVNRTVILPLKCSLTGRTQTLDRVKTGMS